MQLSAIFPNRLEVPISDLVYPFIPRPPVLPRAPHAADTAAADADPAPWPDRLRPRRSSSALALPPAASASSSAGPLQLPEVVGLPPSRAGGCMPAGSSAAGSTGVQAAGATAAAQLAGSLRRLAPSREVSNGQRRAFRPGDRREAGAGFAEPCPCVGIGSSVRKTARLLQRLEENRLRTQSQDNSCWVVPWFSRARHSLGLPL